VRLLPHPWGTRNAYRARLIDGPELVLKTWSESAARRRLRQEAACLEGLAHSAPGLAAPRRATATGEAHLRTSDGLLWTAYDYVPGASPKTATMLVAGQVATALTRLHAAPLAAGVGGSRLTGLERVLSWAQMPSPGPGLGEAVALVRGAGSSPGELPRSMIHGDFNLQNVIVGSAGTVLIDFEFCRHDARLFDLAALVAPLRSEAGGFRRAPPSFLPAVAAHYDRCAGRSGLSGVERAAFPVVAVIHALFVAADLAAAASPFAPMARELVRSLLADPPKL
jgi:Ser/Thr protein kinase RdoA (MazF antagonist)